MCADFDGDGLPDVARTDENGRGITILRNRGDGTFASVGEEIPDVRSFLPAVAGDVDGDGDVDLVLSGERGDTSLTDPQVILLENDGVGRMTPVVLAEGCDTLLPTCLVDLDGDGDLDVAYALHPLSGRTGMGTLVNDGTGSYSAGSDITTPTALTDIAFFGDLDGDGLPDFFGDLSRGFRRNLGGGEFGPWQEFPGFAFGSVVADVTGDGHADVLSGESGRLTLWVGSVDGWVLYDRHYGWDLRRTGGRYTAFLVADLDDDGDLDVAMEARVGEVFFLVNEGAGEFTQSYRHRLPPGVADDLRWLGAGDADGDGTTDLIVFGATGAWLLTPGGEPPPRVTDIEPNRLSPGERYEITLSGTGFSPGTTIQIEGDNEVVDLTYESPERLHATIDVGRYGEDSPGTNSYESFDVTAWSATGGAVELSYESLRVDPWWQHELEVKKGLIKDGPRSGRDRFRVKGDLRFEAATDLRERVGQDLRLVVGEFADGYEVVIPGNDPGWTTTRDEDLVTGWAWRSPKGATPRIRFDLDLTPHLSKFKLDVRKCDLTLPPKGWTWFQLHLGDLRAAAKDWWKPKGKHRLRR
jgi:hypothetical protein